MRVPWQKRRSEFNHDWLKNQYLPALAKFLNLLDDEIDDENYEEVFVRSILPQWKSRFRQLKPLVDQFEDEMSWRTLFKVPPLCNCDKQTKEWLGDLVHSLWEVKYPVKEWTANAILAATKADSSYRQLRKVLETDVRRTNSIESLRSFSWMFEEFRRHCEELSGAIEKFPGEVKLT